MRSLPSAALGALGLFAAATAGRAGDKPVAPPTADPPPVLGGAYMTDGVAYEPADAPFDDVGYAGLDDAAGPAISASHRTLPLPSYVEVTALDTGRTILVRVERRGPASSKQLVALSAPAFAQLGEEPSRLLAVRVRRVNPQEYERALLRTGQRAPERLITPGPLVEVLRRLLAAKTAPVAVTEPGLSESLPGVAMLAKPAPVKAPLPKTSATRPGARFSVQAASFASRANADATARKLGGEVSGSDGMWRVRLGPFAGRAAAATALARAKKAGFGDARVVSLAR